MWISGPATSSRMMDWMDVCVSNVCLCVCVRVHTRALFSALVWCLFRFLLVRKILFHFIFYFSSRLMNVWSSHKPAVCRRCVGRLCACVCMYTLSCGCECAEITIRFHTTYTLTLSTSSFTSSTSSSSSFSYFGTFISTTLFPSLHLYCRRRCCCCCVCARTDASNDSMFVYISTWTRSFLARVVSFFPISSFFTHCNCCCCSCSMDNPNAYN